MYHISLREVGNNRSLPCIVYLQNNTRKIGSTLDEGLGPKCQSYLYSVDCGTGIFLVLFYIYPIVPYASVILHSSCYCLFTSSVFLVRILLPAPRNCSAIPLLKHPIKWHPASPHFLFNLPNYRQIFETIFSHHVS